MKIRTFLKKAFDMSVVKIDIRTIELDTPREKQKEVTEQLRVKLRILQETIAEHVKDISAYIRNLD